MTTHPAVFAFLFWIAAAALVATSHGKVDALSTAGGGVVAIVSIVAVACLYTRTCARSAGVSHALGVGVAWLVLAIVTELAVTNGIGRGWYLLIGAPDHPLLRNVHLFVWIFAPVLFARRETEA